MLFWFWFGLAVSVFYLNSLFLNKGICIMYRFVCMCVCQKTTAHVQFKYAIYFFSTCMIYVYKFFLKVHFLSISHSFGRWCMGVSCLYLLSLCVISEHFCRPCGTSTHAHKQQQKMRNFIISLHVRGVWIPLVCNSIIINLCHVEMVFFSVWLLNRFYTNALPNSHHVLQKKKETATNTLTHFY